MFDTTASLELWTGEFGPLDGVPSVEERAPAARSRRSPVGSAEDIAFLRALACAEGDEWLRCHDSLARHFLGARWRLALRLPRGLCLAYAERHHPGVYGYVLARTNHLDTVVIRALAEGASQLVLLGAGYDSRAHRLVTAPGRVRVFEVDLAPTQERKRAVVGAAGLDGRERVRYVPVDLERRSPEAALVAAGYELGRRTLFVAEGLLYYLSPGAVDRLLGAVTRNAPPGSSVVFDYAVRSFVDGDLSSHGARQAARWFVRAGEPCRSAIADDGIVRFLASRGLALISELGPPQLERGYLTRDDGTLAHRSLGIFRIVQARVVG